MAVSVSKTFTAEVLFASELNTNFTDITGGGIAIISPWTGNCDADGFNLTDMGNIIYREEAKGTTTPETTARSPQQPRRVQTPKHLSVSKRLPIMLLVTSLPDPAS